MDIELLHISHVLILTCLIAVKSFAWNDPVHMVIAKIAKNNLHHGVLSQIEDLADNIDGAFPLSFDFVESACWANGIARGGCRALDSWHERPLPYDPENILTDSERKAMQGSIDQNSSVFALDVAMATLKNPRAGPWEKNFCLRILLHCLGCLHNPLACISLYSHEFPNGDQGGRLFMIESVHASLRTLWDNAFGLDFPDVRGWMNDMTFEQKEELEAMVKEILHTFPRCAFSDLREGSFKDWAKASYELAVQHAYQGIDLGERPSHEYLQRSRQIAWMQMAKAGYRLADVLNEIFQQ